MNCRYCDLPVPDSEASTAPGYWGGSLFPCHKACKTEGIKREAFDCQVIDADCNDCRHFQRGKLLPPVVSVLKRNDGTRVTGIGKKSPK